VWLLGLAPAWAVTDHLQCVKVSNLTLNALRGTVDLESTFGLLPECRIKKASLYCVPATKTIVPFTFPDDFEPLPLAAPPAEAARLCYPLKCKAPNPEQIMTDQFGTHVMLGKKTALLCTPAREGTSYCGDGVVDAGEACDGAQLGGTSCESLGLLAGTLTCTPGCTFDARGCRMPGLLASGQTSCWDESGPFGTVVPCNGTGQDGEARAGAALRYVTNPDGTITDVVTGLQWEKLSRDGSDHDVNKTYTWSQAFEKIAALNAANFAQKSDWRLPNVRELQSLINFETYSPAVSPEFNTGCVPPCTVLDCSCTVGAHYWSSTVLTGYPWLVWFVYFNTGMVNGDPTYTDYRVRAVRGGL
jgi:hypothetical protein